MTLIDYFHVVAFQPFRVIKIITYTVECRRLVKNYASGITQHRCAGLTLWFNVMKDQGVKQLI